MTERDDLQALLRRRAGDIAPGESHPLTVTDVRSRARGIRRRRRMASGVAAAAVLAVVVPVGITLTDGRTSGTDGDRNPPVASASPSQSAESPSASPTGPTKHVLLTTEVEARGAEPGVPYLFGGALTLPDGSQVPLDADYTDLAPLGDDFVLVRQGYVDVVDATGSVTRSEPGTGPLAVSADQSVVVYVGPDGQLMALSPGEDPVEMSRPTAARPATPVSVVADGSCREGSPGGGCAVFYNLDGATPEGRSVTSHGIDQHLQGLRRVAGVSRDGSVSGLTSVSDDGSCSLLLGRSWDVAWRTCRYTLGRFSPDGRYVIGRPAYLDGAGDSSLAVLDARTGRALVEYAADETTQAYIHTAVWDTDGTILATVFQQGSWSLMRMSPDGTLASVSGGGLAGGSDPAVPPLTLPARP